MYFTQQLKTILWLNDYDDNDEDNYYYYDDDSNDDDGD